MTESMAKTVSTFGADVVVLIAAAAEAETYSFASLLVFVSSKASVAAGVADEVVVGSERGGGLASI